jgi:hypothetical protein
MACRFFVRNRRVGLLWGLMEATFSKPMLLCGAADLLWVANPLPPYIICCSTRIFVRPVSQFLWCVICLEVEDL